MTRKRYPKTARTSRSRRRAPYPFERRYASLQEDEGHPVDDVIDRIPPIARLGRKLVRLSRAIQERFGDDEAYLTYEDLRLEQRCTREEAYFDAGFADGRLIERTEGLPHSVSASPEARDLARKVLVQLRSANLPTNSTAALLLEIARSFMMEGGPPISTVRTRAGYAK